MSDKPSVFPPHVRVALSFLWPIMGAAVVGAVGGQLGLTSGVPFLAGLGVISWLLGLRWYGVADMGLRGGRPLTAGIGFAFLGWLAVLLVRIVFVPVDVTDYSARLGRAFLQLLLYEAFCTQLWTFGTLFRSVADWRGPLAAALGGGVVYGVIGWVLFGEATVSPWALLYFVALGLFYGMVRLRTGSLLGMVIVQAMQSLTLWFVLPAPANLPAGELATLYIVSSALFAIIIWRLWPREAADYRI